MAWADGIRDLTPEEEKLITDFVLSCRRDGESVEAAEHLVQKILADDYDKMDFLDFAKRGEKMPLDAIHQYLVCD